MSRVYFGQLLHQRLVELPFKRFLLRFEVEPAEHVDLVLFLLLDRFLVLVNHRFHSFFPLAVLLPPVFHDDLDSLPHRAHYVEPPFLLAAHASHHKQISSAMAESRHTPPLRRQKQQRGEAFGGRIRPTSSVNAWPRARAQRKRIRFQRFQINYVHAVCVLEQLFTDNRPTVRVQLEVKELLHLVQN